MSITVHAVVFASLLLALPAQAHARDPQRAPPTRITQPAPPTRITQPAPRTRITQPAPPTRITQPAPPTRITQPAPPTRNAQRAPRTRITQPTPPTRNAQRASPLHTLRGELGANQIVAFGLPASPSVGISPFITFRWADTSLSFEPRVLTAVTPPAELAGILIRAWMSVVSACRHPRIFSLCGVIQLGRTSLANSTNLFVEKNALFVAFGARVGAGWRVSRYLSLHAAVELHGHVGRPEVWDRTTLLWRTPLASAITALGVTVPLTPE